MQNPTFTVVSMVMEPSGTHHSLLLRPYTARVSHSDQNEYTRNTQNGVLVQPSTVASVAGRIISPATEAVAAINIPNGWAEQRFNFTLVVQCTTSFGVVNQHHYSGYCDVMDYSQGYGAAMNINPATRMYITGRRVVQTAGVVKTLHYDHVLTDPNKNITPLQQTPINNSPFSSPNTMAKTMRPADVTATIGCADVFPAGEQVIDFRTGFAVDPVRLSSVTHAHVPTYMATTINCIKTANDLVESEVSPESRFGVYSGAAQNIDQSAQDDPLLAYLLLRTEYKTRGYVTYGELDRLLGIDRVTQIDIRTQPSSARFGTSTVGFGSGSNFADWSGSTHNVVIATKIKHSMASLATSLGIMAIGFDATNRTVDNSYNVVVQYARYMVGVVGNQAELTERFKRRMIAEVLPFLTANRQIDVVLSVEYQALADTYISVSVMGEPTVTRVVPNRIAPMASPVVAPHGSYLDNLSNALSVLADVSNSPVDGTATPVYHQGFTTIATPSTPHVHSAVPPQPKNYTI